MATIFLRGNEFVQFVRNQAWISGRNEIFSHNSLCRMENKKNKKKKTMIIELVEITARF